MSKSDAPVASNASRSATKPPPAWLICACMFVFAAVTIVLVITGQ